MYRKLLMPLSLLLIALIVAACGGAPAATPGTGAGANPTPTTGTGVTGATTTGARTTAATTAATGAAATAPRATGTATARATSTATRAAAPAGAPAAAASPVGRVGGNLVIYSARKEELMKPLVEAFERQTGVKVTLKSGGAGELAQLIERERGNTLGDVLFTTDAASAEALRQKGLLEPYVSPNAAKIPAEFKAADGAWTGTIGRSRNIMYNTNLARPEELPKSVYELTDPKYRGKVAMASIREGSVKLWLASMIQERGEDFTVKYINDLKANGLKVLANHTEVANAVSRGEVTYGLVNHYYYVPAKREGQPVGLIYPDQGPNEGGTLVVPLAVSILKGAKNQAQARAFVDFALSQEGQLPLTTQENEFPLTPGVGLGEAAAPGVKPIDEIKRPTTDYAKLADIEKRVVDLFTPILGGGQ